MIRRELIQVVVVKVGFTNAQAETTLDTFGVIITEAFVADKKIQLPGAFTASTTQHAEHKGRNPVTGEAATIPACRVMKFAPVSILKDVL